MPRPTPQSIRAILSGQDDRWRAAGLRGAAALLEPFYAAAMSLRNTLYDRGWKASHELGRPVVSVGNLTAGGTGKTPLVLWLAERLREAGLRPGILLRGYKRQGEAPSDEQAMLEAALRSEAWPVPVRSNPDRVIEARRLLEAWPQTDVILLDDAFQHRRARRQVDVVLIDATEPFGFGHVHPRGLLREPLRGVARADLVIISRCDQVDGGRLEDIEQTVRRHNPRCPLFHARHVLDGLRPADAAAQAPPPLALDWLQGRRFFAVAGIANPASLESQVGRLPGRLVGRLWFADHHAYTPADVRRIAAAARNADVVLVTEKDWVKLAGLDLSGLTVLRLSLRIEFRAGEQEELLRRVRDLISGAIRPCGAGSLG